MPIKIGGHRCKEASALALEWLSEALDNSAKQTYEKSPEQVEEELIVMELLVHAENGDCGVEVWTFVLAEDGQMLAVGFEVDGQTVFYDHEAHRAREYEECRRQNSQAS